MIGDLLMNGLALRILRSAYVAESTGIPTNEYGCSKAPPDFLGKLTNSMKCRIKSMQELLQLPGKVSHVMIRALLLTIWMVLLASQLTAVPPGCQSKLIHLSLATGQIHLADDCHCCDEVAPACGHCKPQPKKSQCQCQSSSPGENQDLPPALLKPSFDRSAVVLPPVVTAWLCCLDNPQQVNHIFRLGLPPPLPDLNPNRFRGPPTLA